MKNPEKYNALGYLDLTAYYALKKIEHEETEKKGSEEKAQEINHTKVDR